VATMVSERDPNGDRFSNRSTPLPIKAKINPTTTTPIL